jgi:predicted permease
MMPGNVFRLQLMSGLADRRRIILRIGVSLLLVSPFIFVAMPAHAQAKGIVMVAVFTTFFGSAVAHTRLRSDLRISRLKLLPISRRKLWLDLILSSSLLRVMPIVIMLTGYIAVNGRTVTLPSLVVVLGMLLASILLLTIIGILIGRVARSNAEVHLFGALTCAVIAFASGITPLPQRLAPLQAAMVFNPVSRLLQALIRLADIYASVSLVEFVLALLVILAVSLAAAFSWISDGKYDIQKLDSQSAAAHNDEHTSLK